MKRTAQFGPGCVTLLLGLGAAHADTVTVPNQFAAGTPAVASEMNDNFVAIETAVNANDALIAELKADNSTLSQRIVALEAFIAELQAVMSVTTDERNNAAVVFSGVNVHVNNGSGQTDFVNGLGNLIVGYDEVQAAAVEFCSDASFDDETACTEAGEIFADVHKSGSHSLIVGLGHNYSQAGAFIAGAVNSVNAGFASVSGGLFNRASGISSSVTGGADNVAAGSFSSIAGGNNNLASAQGSSIAGGLLNEASGSFSSVAGGSSNVASGRLSSVAGGRNNVASGTNASVAGGRDNLAIGANAAVSGGAERAATDSDDWAAGDLKADF